MKKTLPLLLVALLAGCASTSDLDATRRQLDEIQRNSQQRFSQIETKISNEKLLEMVNQVEVLKSEVAKLRGDVEVLNYNLQTTQKRQNDLYNDLDQRLAPLEGKKADGGEAVANTDTAQSAASPQAAPVDSTNADYERALGLLRNRDFKKAIPALKTFIDANPSAKQTPEARFWLGIAYNAERQYQPAIDTYNRFIELSPNHPKVPDALRNIGGCQRDLGDANAARATWQKLIKKYPKSDAAAKAKQQLATLK